MFVDCQTNLYVADMQRALGFYDGLLGFTPFYRFPHTGDPQHVELRLGASVLALTVAEGLRSHRLPPATPGEPFELVVQATDVKAAVEHLRAGGTPVMLEPVITAAGNWVAYVRDPDGNRVQIYSPA